MDERDDQQQEPQPEPPGGWLPPQPPGAPPPPPPQQAPPPPPQAPPPPPPPPGPQAPAPPQQFPPPSYPPPPPPPPAPGYQQYPYPYPPAPAYQPLPPQPPNNDAVAGFTCAVIGAVLLFFTAGLSSIISLILGIIAIPYSRKGKRVIAEGKTLKHKDLANAGYVTGIVVVVLSVLATITWALLFALVDWDEIDDESNDSDDEFSLLRPGLRMAVMAARLLG